MLLFGDLVYYLRRYASGIAELITADSIQYSPQQYEIFRPQPEQPRQRHPLDPGDDLGPWAFLGLLQSTTQRLLLRVSQMSFFVNAL